MHVCKNRLIRKNYIIKKNEKKGEKKQRRKYPKQINHYKIVKYKNDKRKKE